MAVLLCSVFILFMDLLGTAKAAKLQQKVSKRNNGPGRVATWTRWIHWIVLTVLDTELDTHGLV